jgi:pimeloyl-ACP methyl ester carboxylesterase
MEPVIKYAKTSDGVNIAYYAIGHGVPPLVYVVPFSHVVQEWHHPELSAWSQGLSAKRRLVRLDRRGTGLSDWDQEFTLESAGYDIEAVVRKEGLKRFALMGQQYTAAMAILYAAHHPEAVSHLVLWSPVARAQASLAASPPLQAAYAAGDKDWRTFTELFAQQATGWADADQARRFAAYLRDVGYTSEQHSRTLPQQYDVSDCLRRLTMPVLVMHRRESAFPAIDVVRSLAAETPTARFVLFEGSAILPVFGDSRAVLDTIDAFLSEANEPRPAGLTDREVEILSLLAGGSTNEQISRALSISTRTVERHIGNTYLKIGAHNRAEATAYAFRHSLAPYG